MTRKIRYGDYLGRVRVQQRVISYNEVTAWDRKHRRRPRLRPRDIHRLVAPYLSSRFLDQFRAVIPVTLFLVSFQVLVLKSGVSDVAAIGLGIVGVMLGLMFFMEGLKHGLMPFSENIGHLMPGRTSYSAVLAVAFILGAAATFAEPAIGALKSVGSLTDPESAAWLSFLLNQRSEQVVVAVAVSVGLAVLVSMLRFMQGWAMKPVVLIVTLACLALTWYLASDPALAPIIGLAWDCGAITTGPVTVPIVLALGVGVSAAAGREDNPLAGFGIVTLASLFPPLAVMALGVYTAETADLGQFATPAAAAGPGDGGLWGGALNALRAIVPLAALLWLIQRVWLREPLRHANLIGYGILLCVLGMAAFNMGLDAGLSALGMQVGDLLSTAFSGDESLYPYWAGLGIALAFALLLGFGATIAEPALNALGMTVQNLTDGAFRKQTLIRAVALGVGIGTALGMAKVIFDLPLAWLLIPGYLLALVLTILSSEEYVNLAWDSAGVTTGPVTVPLVLAMGLGLGRAVDAHEGFGILAMASVGPIVSVLAVGLWLQVRARFLRFQFVRMMRNV
ncbi:MAG TPA: DUF1538 domain-containing protein [Thiobacillaceae bacterium]|nr:DUF1538 domain-containing protein [Thiobacillaceae bacterium]